MKKELTTLVLVLFSSIGGFLIGKKYVRSQKAHVPIATQSPEHSIVIIEKITDDLLVFSLPERVRLVWADGKNSVEEAGLQTVPLGQIETENSKKFSQFRYVGNAKTKKFYPTNSYPARGTEIRYRRFFDTKEAAISAGFIASKLVK